MRFAGKSAIVTGGAGMIGFATAKRLSEEGAKVAIVDINQEAVQHALEQLKYTGTTVIGFTVDIKVSRNVDQVVDAVKERFSSVDILVNCAGGSARKQMTHLVNQTDEVLENMIGVNLMGPLYFMRACGRIMQEQHSGKIISFASTSGIQGNYRQVEYAASKGGVMSATKALAKELGEYGVNVNCVAPGLIPHDDGDYSATNYLKRNPRPEEIAAAVCFLASEDASFITGQTLVVDGGRSLALRGSF